MPPFKPVSSLQTLTLRTVAHLIRRLCYDCAVTVEDLKPVIDHFRFHLPPQIQADICHTLLHDSHKIVFPELLNQKYLVICTKLHASYIWISYSQSIMPLMKEMNGHSVKTLKMTGAQDHMDFDSEKNSYYQQVIKFEPLYSFLGTLTNLTTLKCSQMCSNSMLQLFSKTCPHLEDIDIEMCTDVDDEGIFHLAGHIPTPDTYSMIKRGFKCLLNLFVQS